MSAQILFSRHDAVGLITLNRPDCQSYGGPLGDPLNAERVNQLRLFKTAEARDAMRAFLSKTSSPRGPPS